MPPLVIIIIVPINTVMTGMNAVVMCGGKGSRMAREFSVEKPMLLIKGKPMIEYVLDAIVESNQFTSVFAVSSNHTTGTAAYLRCHKYHLAGIVKLISTTGIDYSTDLVQLIELLKPSQIFVVPSDIPLLNVNTVIEILNCWTPACRILSVLLEKKFVLELGIKPSIEIPFKGVEYCHSGISILDTSQIRSGSDIVESYLAMNRKEIAFNVNTKDDLVALTAEIS